MAAKKKLPGGVNVPGGLFDVQRAKEPPHPGPLPPGEREKSMGYGSLPPGEREKSGGPGPLPPEKTSTNVVEFRGADGRDWRIERWEEFVAEMQTPEFKPRAQDWEAGMPVLHATLTQKGNERPWLIMRRLFGFMPVRVGLNEDPEQWRTWTPAELCQELGLDAAGQFQQEMRSLRVGVAKCVGSTNDKNPNDERNDKFSSAKDGVSGELFETTDEELLTKYGYSASMFEALVSVRMTLEGRDVWESKAREKAENAIELKWFCGRLREVEKLMPLAIPSQLARSMLMHELRMRRAQTDLFRYAPGSPEYERARVDYDKAEASHRETIGRIDEVAPWFNVSGKDAGLTASVGDIVKAMQQWHARGDKKLIDGLFTAASIQVQLRTSKQFEDPKYRLGWNLYVMDSRRGIWDPNWKSQLKERDLKKLDRGFKDGALAVMEEEGEEPIDLLKKGDEYEDLGPDGPGLMTNDKGTNDKAESDFDGEKSEASEPAQEREDVASENEPGETGPA